MKTWDDLTKEELRELAERLWWAIGQTLNGFQDAFDATDDAERQRLAAQAFNLGNAACNVANNNPERFLQDPCFKKDN